MAKTLTAELAEHTENFEVSRRTRRPRRFSCLDQRLHRSQKTLSRRSAM